jgi:hypothetical protein
MADGSLALSKVDSPAGVSIWTLPADIRSRVESLSTIAPAILAADPDGAARQLGAELRTSLPQEWAGIFDLIASANATPINLFKGVPIDPELPPTPVDGINDPAQIPNAVKSMLAVAGAMGLRIMAYETMTNTAFIRNISPTLEHAEKMGSYGSKVKLPMHTEISQGKLPGGEPGVTVSPSPDFLVLYCCRNDEGAPTTFCLLDTILAGMPNWAVDALKEPKFVVSGGDSFTTVNVLDKVALLRPDPVTGWLQLRYNGTNITTDDATCAEAFRILEERLDDPEVVQRVKLEPGDLLVLENRRTTHGREPFVARHDGTDRWLLRLYTVRESTFEERVCTDEAKPSSWYV